jgi:hypothetical protein
MDIWIETSIPNAKKLTSAFRDFGITDETISENLFLEPNKIIRMGVPPVRLEVITGASGLDFNECYGNREINLTFGFLTLVIFIKQPLEL